MFQDYLVRSCVCRSMLSDIILELNSKIRGLKNMTLLKNVVMPLLWYFVSNILLPTGQMEEFVRTVLSCR